MSNSRIQVKKGRLALVSFAGVGVLAFVWLVVSTIVGLLWKLPFPLSWLLSGVAMLATLAGLAYGLMIAMFVLWEWVTGQRVDWR